MFSFLTVFKVINLQDRPLQNKDFIHRGLGGPRLASVCWEQTDDVETTASRFHNYCALRSYVLQLILWTESVWFVPCWFQYHQINYDSLKENFAWTESLSMFDCGAAVCRANSISITGWPKHMLLQKNELVELWHHLPWITTYDWRECAGITVPPSEPMSSFECGNKDISSYHSSSTSV